MTKTLGEIAALVGGRLAGNAAILISGATNIESAGAEDITFAVEPHVGEAEAGGRYFARYGGRFF